MTLLPIVERELRAASRKSKTYSARTVHAGAAVIAITVMYFGMTSSRPVASHTLGAALFETAVWLNFVFCVFMGVHLTSDCISEEKREGTLGFLFLTDLKGYDVILGKLAATSMAAGYAMLAGLPVMAIPMLLGGVTARDFWRAALVLMVTLFFSLTAGIFISTWNRDARRAGGWTFILILLCCVGGPMVGYAWVIWLDRTSYGIPVEFQLLIATSPVCACSMVTGPTRYTWMFWMSTTFTFWVGCVFLMLAARRVRRTWQDKPAAVKQTGVGKPNDSQDEWDRKRLLYESQARHEYRTRLLNINAMLWLANRSRFKEYLMWGFIGMAATFWFWGAGSLPRDWIDFGITLGFCWMNHLVLKLAVATEAGERFGLDMQSGALELLLSTRMKVEDILQGQLLALKRHFWRPAVTVLVADVVLLALTLCYSATRGSERDDMTYALVASIIAFLADTWALSWVGMWTGLTARDMKKASTQAVFRVLVTPWIIVITASWLWDAARWYWLQGEFEIPFAYKVTAWLFLSLANDWILGRWARQHLRNEFRLAAMRRYDPPVKISLWQKLKNACARGAKFFSQETPA